MKQYLAENRTEKFTGDRYEVADWVRREYRFVGVSERFATIIERGVSDLHSYEIKRNLDLTITELG